MSARLLLTMSDEHKLKVMCGDAGNAFPNAPTDEKVRTIAREEFEEHQGCAVEITRSLHGMSAASRFFSLHLGYFIRTLGFPLQERI